MWYARERTLSIHSITTTPREVFYWLAILVTFALGTAAGDWILELTGWGPGKSVLLPAGLIVAISIGWRLGANAVLSFWLAYILTRPLGANLGDWLGFPKDQQGLGLGVAITSVIFLSAILATVVYLSITRADVIEKPDETTTSNTTKTPVREHVMHGYFVVIALATGALLVWAADQPHSTAAASENESGGSSVTATLAPGQSATAKFPAGDVTTSVSSRTTRLRRCKRATRRARRLASRILKPLGMTGRRPWSPWTRLAGRHSTARSTVR